MSPSGRKVYRKSLLKPDISQLVPQSIAKSAVSKTHTMNEVMIDLAQLEKDLISSSDSD